MTIKLLQLNIYNGHRLSDIIHYVKKHNFDILHLQEVSGGVVAEGAIDCFSLLTHALGYNGYLVKTWKVENEPDSYFGNATFYKSELMPVSKKTIWLKPYEEIPQIEGVADKVIENLPRAAHDMVFTLNGKKIHFINTHLAWGKTPFDKPYKIEQAKILAEYIESLNEPFVLTGDYNVVPKTEVVGLFDTLGANLVTKFHIKNTLNPTLHRVKHLFPKGLAVDYIHIARSLAVSDFDLVDSPDLSDHYGLRVNITV